MKLTLFLMVLYLGSNQWKSQADDKPYSMDTDEDVKDFYPAFVEDLSVTDQDIDPLGSSSIFEKLQEKEEKGENEDLDSLNQFNNKDMTTVNAEKRRKIENLINGGNDIDPGYIDDASGPKCYSCFGNDLNSCLSIKKEKQCQSSHKCYTVQLVYRATGKSSFVKGCISTATCQSDICQTIRNNSKGIFSSCKADCCQGSLCNGANAGTTTKPSGTPATTKPPVTGPKCYSCQGTDLASCASRMTKKQCLPNYQCADAYLTTMSNGKSLTAKGCIPSKICRAGLCNQLNSTGKYSDCKSSCCGDDLCNAIPTVPTTRGVTTELPSTTGKVKYTTERPTKQPHPPMPEPNPTTDHKSTSLPTPRPLPSQPPTHRPVTVKPTGLSQYKCYTCSSQTQQECYSKHKLNLCDRGKVCFTGRATRNNGVKMFAKGCMKPDQCATSCKRLSLTTKDCKVECCHGNYCNSFSLTTQRPTIPQSGCFSILIRVLDVMKSLVETINALIKFNAVNEGASEYKRKIDSLMTKLDAEAFHVTGNDNPAVRNAMAKMSTLRRRANDVLKKLDEIIAKR